MNNKFMASIPSENPHVFMKKILYIWISIVTLMAQNALAQGQAVSGVVTGGKKHCQAWRSSKRAKHQRYAHRRKGFFKITLKDKAIRSYFVRLVSNNKKLV
jgi:hypothetical protein